MIERLNAWRLGIADGLENPFDLGSGLTWDNQKMNEAYDAGVNVGQLVGKLPVLVEIGRGAVEALTETLELKKVRSYLP